MDDFLPRFLANLLMSHFERVLESEGKCFPRFRLRYMDDIFSLSYPKKHNINIEFT